MNRVTATFSILSKMIHPDRISELLLLSPDNSVLRGVDRNPPRSHPNAFGWYVYCVETNKVNVSETLSILLDRIEVSADKIYNIRNVDPDIEIKFSLSVAPFSADVSLYIENEIIKKISRLGGDLDIEFFDLQSSDSEFRCPST